MKKSLIVLALLAAAAAHAQDSTSSGTANSSASSNPVLNNAGNGNSSSGATVDGVNSMSQSNPNNANAQTIVFNQPGATSSSSTAHVTSDGTSTQRLEGGTNSTVRNINEGVSTQNVHYSGTQTVKNVPGIQMSGPASGPCTGASGGVGLAGPGWGVGFNGSGVMADCRIRENVRVLGMAMQSLDGNANPQEKGETTVLFMNAVRGLAAYNDQVLGDELKGKK